MQRWKLCSCTKRQTKGEFHTPDGLQPCVKSLVQRNMQDVLDEEHLLSAELALLGGTKGSLSWKRNCLFTSTRLEGPQKAWHSTLGQQSSALTYGLQSSVHVSAFGNLQKSSAALLWLANHSSKPVKPTQSDYRFFFFSLPLNIIQANGILTHLMAA